jgi:hypothetical protein
MLKRTKLISQRSRSRLDLLHRKPQASSVLMKNKRIKIQVDLGDFSSYFFMTASGITRTFSTCTPILVRLQISSGVFANVSHKQCVGALKKHIHIEQRESGAADLQARTRYRQSRVRVNCSERCVASGAICVGLKRCLPCACSDLGKKTTPSRPPSAAVLVHHIHLAQSTCLPARALC